jgi:uncharacterized protein (TIGR02145 family)
MKTTHITVVFISIVLAVFLYNCAVIVELPGDIRGFVTDAETGEPLDSATVELNQSNSTLDIDTTLNDGSYLFSNIEPGNYQIEASKPAYEKITKNVTVTSGIATEVDIELNAAPYPEYSDTYLDFGDESNVKTFTISNAGSGTLNYSLFTSKDWITVDPKVGDATTETDTIKVTIDRTGLGEKTNKEVVRIVTYIGNEQITDTVGVFVNGVMGLLEEKYYEIVKIGTQTWMAENLNSGTMIDLSPRYTTDAMKDDGVIQKFCYDDDPENCEIYGGLYTWDEAMGHPPPYPHAMADIHQGICPDGWHVPTGLEYKDLWDYLGYASGGKLRDTGNLQDGDGLWEFPNTGATNESGFSALPGGKIWWDDPNESAYFTGKGERFYAWRKSRSENNSGVIKTAPFKLNYDSNHYDSNGILPENAVSVRCIKDPE